MESVTIINLCGSHTRTIPRTHMGRILGRARKECLHLGLAACPSLIQLRHISTHPSIHLSIHLLMHLCFHPSIHPPIQTGTNIHIYLQTDRQPDRQPDRQTDRQKDTDKRTERSPRRVSKDLGIRRLQPGPSISAFPVRRTQQNFDLALQSSQHVDRSQALNRPAPKARKGYAAGIHG